MIVKKCKNCAHFGGSGLGEPGYCLWGKAMPPVLRKVLAAMEAEPSAQIAHTTFDGMEVKTGEDDLCSGYSGIDL